MKPRDQGFFMPAEWAPHSGCWMGWPQRESIWHGFMEGARDDYVKVARAIARFEPLTMLADPSSAADAARRCGPTVRVLPVPLDDSWLRDSGPTFLVDGAGRRAASLFVFNAWGEKCAPFDRDAALGARIAEIADVPASRSGLVVEGGGFLSDGEGTLITAESCVLNPNRNPGWVRAEADAELRAMLGVEKIIWLPGDLTDQATDGHVDGYVAFFRPGGVLLETVVDPADPRHAIMAENRRVLETERDARGRTLELVPIAEAPRSSVPAGEEIYCRSYVNFYLANGAVIAPAYGIAEDAAVRETLSRAYPTREVVTLELEDLFRGGGGIHCITQQEPSARG
ncbi:MAG TPA: agmatine deiminase family protein [Steroidobacteraceae bacterium]|jgi:agmatine deiminase|nr:agmatine deiminase family protein [Steroidobacteraceae bacterium]